jgi:membrane-associated phospholipid phosphatase
MPDLLRRIHACDQRLIDRIAATDSMLLDRVLPPLGEAANFSALRFGVTVVFLATGPAAARRGAVRGVGGIAIASATSNVLAKELSRRGRPVVDRLPVVRRVRRQPVTTSFPSGHAASAAAFATAVTLEAPAIGVPLGVLAAGVAASRVVTGAHFPSDVAAGAALGVAVAVFTRRRRAPGGRRRRAAGR